MAERTIHLGRTEDAAAVKCTIHVEHQLGRRTFTDHVERSSPVRLSITWSVAGGYDKREEYGQIPSAERAVLVIAPGITRSLIDTLDRLWSEHHNHNLHAECDHMTPEMLDTDGDALLKYQQRHPHRRFYGRADTLTNWRLDNVSCPVTGYRWGSAWLAREVPEHDLALASAIILTGAVPE